MPIHDDSIIFMDCLPIKTLVTLNHSNELTPLLPVLDYELFEGKNCVLLF